MNVVTESVTHKDGYNLHIVPSKKYKTINIVAKFKAPLSKDTITMRALLPYILRQGTKSFPTEQQFQIELDRLYGAVLSIDGAKKGNNHIISIRLEVANDKFIENESSIFDQALKLLEEIIFHPNVHNGQFNEQVFKREKETLLQKIKAMIDDKMSYANIRLIDEMCKGEAYALHSHGYENDLHSLTAAKLYDYYQEMLNENQLDIYVLGEVKEPEIEEKIPAIIRKDQIVQKHVGPTEEDVSKAINKKPQTVIEKQNVQQANLQLGYRTNCTFQDEGYFALQVFNGLFGGFPNSKLFLNVREKHSLAYYAASRIESHKGLLLVFSGIDTNDYEQAREIIELQMTAMKNGEFGEAELEETKELIINQLLETLDNPQGMIELLYQQVVANTKMAPHELIDNIKQVTKKDVINMANQIEADTVYLLTSERGNENE